MRKKQLFEVKLNEPLKEHLLGWAIQYENAIWLDGNNHADKYGAFDALLAVGGNNKSFHTLEMLQAKLENLGDWLFGYFSYDLKNELEQLSSNNYDGLGFRQLDFFVPDKIIRFNDGTAELLYQESCFHELQEDLKQIKNPSAKPKKCVEQGIKIKLRIHKDAYFEKVGRLLEHIHRGDVYEANFCQEFYALNTEIDPVSTYLKLNSISTPPFATFMKLGERYLLSASPERYLRKKGAKIISQPIKGTAPRSKNFEEDKMLKEELASNDKERAENIMITDLVRNDLSRFAKRGTVKVEELCNVHSYRQVHQMVSTISCSVDEKMNLIEIIKKTFPMGSMTGAPKISAMQLIEALEETKRGLYSGAVGYFNPSGDFDFSVVIRSILYNAINNYVSYSVGSAITAKSSIEKEYQECLLKAKAMRSVLEG
ncbi:anthranilate synthase component I family protein [Allomuricauda sp. d1]|uniref:anthranilate synthase component I family protein n=1 Tax=Allomuricauda sp. d1 TaxID=3136725 RepID=UPI0031E18156